MYGAPFRPAPARMRPARLAPRALGARALVVLAVVLAGWMAAPPAGAAPLSTTGTVYFSETGHSLSNGFLSYWLWHGQGDRWGYPLTDELQEGGRTVQYLARGRLEYDPAAPAASRVTASATGSLLTADRVFPPGAPLRPSATATYCAATHHTLRNTFYDYWQAHGGLDSFGYPISEEFREGAHTVQYFERARFELTYDGGVWLGTIGQELLQRRSALITAQTVTRPEFAMTFTGGATWFPGNWQHIISLNESWGNLPYGYHGYGLYAAMPADLHLYGRWGRVTRNGKSIWVQFVDVINWSDIAQVRADGKVIDLGTESFAQLASLQDGVIRVKVEVAWPGFHPDFAR